MHMKFRKNIPERFLLSLCFVCDYSPNIDMGSGAKPSRFKSWLSHLLAVKLWEVHLDSLCFCFLVYSKGVNKNTTSSDYYVRIKRFNTYEAFRTMFDTP